MNIKPTQLEGSHKTGTVAALVELRPFIGPAQRHALADLCRGEEKQFFFDKTCELADLVRTMPKTYEQEGKGAQAVVSLHYFTSGCDWHITERDMYAEQAQAFGQADLGYGPELGYISIIELLENGAELDFHFTPCTIAALNEKRQVAA